MSHPARFAAACLVALAACGGPELYLENDVVAPGRKSDRNYTHGTRLQYTFDAEEAPEWIEPAIGLLNPLRWDEATELGLTIGQQIFTPTDLDTRRVIENDRPYAGWLFGGIARYDGEYDEDPARRRDTQISTEFIAGVLGPPSFAEDVQSWVHELSDSTDPMGWDNQIDTEPTFMMGIQRQDRIWAEQLGGLGFDFITRVGASVGTPVTNGFFGATVRGGWNLPRDFAVSPTNPSLSYSAASRRNEFPHSIHVFGGAVGRGVAYSSFLDGNLFTDSHSVDREEWLADFEYGFAIQMGEFRIGLTVVERTPEFKEREDNHTFGSLHVSWTSKD